MMKKLGAILLALSLLAGLLTVPAGAAERPRQLSEITIAFEKNGVSYEMTFTNVASIAIAETADGRTYPHTIFYYPGATVSVARAMDNSADFTNGFFLETNYHFGADGRVAAGTVYSIEEVFARLFKILNGGAYDVSEGTGVVGLGPVFLVPWTTDVWYEDDAVMTLLAAFQKGGSADLPSPWAREQVTAAIEAGIVPEQLQTDYAQSTTRAQFCGLAVAVYETVTETQITGRTRFSDTADENVEKAAAIGVVSGVGDGRFDPDQPLTREQAAAMLARLAQALERPLDTRTADFSDSGSISDWALQAVGQMQEAGIMDGVGEGRFDPQAPYTREQSIVTALRLYERMAAAYLYLPIPGTDFEGEPTLRELLDYGHAIGYTEGKYDAYPTSSGFTYYTVRFIAPASKGERIVVTVRIGPDAPYYSVSAFSGFTDRGIGIGHTVEQTEQLLADWAGG